jgi:hypothetical protein
MIAPKKIMFKKLPAVVIPIALGLAVALYSVVGYDGSDAFFRLWYYVPAAITVGFLATDRIQAKHATWIGRSMDYFVLAVCATRPLFGWPAVSGHALLFVYARFVGSSVNTRVCAVGLGLITCYAKIWLWNWDPTLWPGVILGIICGYVTHRLERQNKPCEETSDNITRSIGN